MSHFRRNVARAERGWNRANSDVRRFIIPFLLLSGSVFAEKEETATHEFRIFPVGDPPPFRQEVRNGIRYEVEPPDGSVPPDTIILPENDGAGAGVRVRLGTLSEAFALPVNESGMAGFITSEGDTWLRVAARPGGSSILLAWRKGARWKEVGSLSIPLNDSRPDRVTVHVANVSDSSAGIVIGEDKIRLDHGMRISRSFDVNSPAVPFQVLVANHQGVLVPILSSRVETGTPVLRVVAIHRADGENPRFPVKVTEAEEIYVNHPKE